MDSKSIQNVVVAGSGTMGPGIAMTFARAGLSVSLVDIRKGILEKGWEKIRSYLDLFAELGVIQQEDKEPILSRVRTSTDLEKACKQADYFMEAVPEILEVKQEVFRLADRWCPQGTILTSNASNMKVEPIASVTGRPERVVVTHWVNPPHIMQLVEIARGPSTTEETIQTVRGFLTRVGKAPIVCQDTLSYLNNAMQGALTKVALELWEKGIASPEDIDRAVNTGFGFRLPIVGPLAFLDMAGLDNVRDGWEYLNRMTGGGFGPLPQAVQKLVEQGHWGLKTGKGIYNYSEKEVLELAKEREKKLILQLKALGRI
jgi:3-hydroxyacyl-CoA dehydrogenase